MAHVFAFDWMAVKNRLILSIKKKKVSVGLQALSEDTLRKSAPAGEFLNYLILLHKCNISIKMMQEFLQKHK